MQALCRRARHGGLRARAYPGGHVVHVVHEEEVLLLWLLWELGPRLVLQRILQNLRSPQGQPQEPEHRAQSTEPKEQNPEAVWYT